MQPWQTLSKKDVFATPWLRLVESKVITPNGKPGTYTIVETNPFVVVVAHNQGTLLMVQQHRFTVNTQTLEFPAGTIENGETPLAAAKREFHEETGLAAQKIRILCELDDAIGIARHKAFVFLADATKNAPPTANDDGILGKQWLPIADIEKLIANGDIADTKTIAVFYKALQALRH